MTVVERAPALNAAVRPTGIAAWAWTLVVLLAASAHAGEAGRRVGDEDETVAAISSDGTTIALRKADRLRVVDLRQGRVGASRLVPEDRIVLLADQAGPLVLIDAGKQVADRLDPFVDRPALQTLRLPRGVVAAAIDAGAGAVAVVTEEAGPGTSGSPKAQRVGRRSCVHRLHFVDGTSARFCPAMLPSPDDAPARPPLLPPQLAFGHAGESIWWLSPRCVAGPPGSAGAATCATGGRRLVLTQLAAATLQPLGSLDSAAPDAPWQPTCAQAPLVDALRLDSEVPGVSFVSRRAEAPGSAALWTVLPRASGLAVGFHCLPAPLDAEPRFDAAGTPLQALIGVAGSAVALDATATTGPRAVAAPRSTGAPRWWVTADGNHAALQQGRLLTALGRDGVLGVATSREVLAALPSRLVWRDGDRAIRAATWEEMVVVPAPPEGLDAVLSWLEAGLLVSRSSR